MPASAREVDLVIVGGAVMTMDSDHTVIEDGVVVIHDGRIEAVGERADLAGSVQARRQLDARDAVIMPGLINSHTHVLPILLRGGLAGDRNLYDWLVNVLYPGLDQVTPKDARVAASLYALEATRAGVTTIVENADIGRRDEIAEATLETLTAAGLRVIYARLFYDSLPDEMATAMRGLRAASNRWDPAGLVEATDDALSAVESLMARWQGRRDGRVQVWPAPAMPQTTTEAGLRGAHELAERHDVHFTIHVAQAESDGWDGDRRVIEVMDSAGILGPRLLAAHCVWLTGPEIELLARTGVAVAHNPVSNLYLAAGIAPVADMVRRGVPVCLGTDDANSNETVNLLAELRTAALLQRVRTGDAAALPAGQVVAMATSGAAACLGLEREVGSLVPGKRADVIVVGCEEPQLTPLHDPAHGLVFQALGSEVRSTVVGGEVLMEDRRLTSSGLSDADQIRAAAQAASLRIAAGAGLR